MANNNNINGAPAPTPCHRCTQKKLTNCDYPHRIPCNNCTGQVSRTGNPVTCHGAGATPWGGEGDGSKSSKKCHNCGRGGHYIAACPIPIRQSSTGRGGFQHRGSIRGRGGHDLRGNSHAQGYGGQDPSYAAQPAHPPPPPQQPQPMPPAQQSFFADPNPASMRQVPQDTTASRSDATATMPQPAGTGRKRPVADDEIDHRPIKKERDASTEPEYGQAAYHNFPSRRFPDQHQAQSTPALSGPSNASSAGVGGRGAAGYNVDDLYRSHPPSAVEGGGTRLDGSFHSFEGGNGARITQADAEQPMMPPSAPRSGFTTQQFPPISDYRQDRLPGSSFAPQQQFHPPSDPLHRSDAGLLGESGEQAIQRPSQEATHSEPDAARLGSFRRNRDVLLDLWQEADKRAREQEARASQGVGYPEADAALLNSLRRNGDFLMTLWQEADKRAREEEESQRSRR